MTYVPTTGKQIIGLTLSISRIYKRNEDLLTSLKNHFIHSRLYTVHHKQWKSGLKNVLFRKAFCFCA